MKYIPLIACVTFASAGVTYAANEATAGPFSGEVTVFPGNTAPLAQTPSPDNTALSLLFQGLQVVRQGDGSRSDANHLALRIPLTISAPSRIKAELRGGIAADSGVECRLSLDGPDGRAVFMSRQAPQAHLKTVIPVSVSDNELKLLIGVRCTGRIGTHPVFVASVDSLDLSLEAPTKPLRHR
ncbi:MAG TPA: hypothetical protein PKD04_09370 [Rhodocyclaceae bacterium]|nr:hypothetical protein [Rhodocyclaceae bacterium]HNA87414.1 hypothetical protein [Nitrospira sp.]HNI20655.1 hypothetical protein [Nitrospira sp.]